MSTTIESKKVTVETKSEEVFDFALDLNNFEKLLPEGKIKNFTSDGVSCSFEIKGTAKLGLRIVESKRPSMILLKSENSPFPFTLKILIREDNDNRCTAHQISELDVNPFMSAMVKKPLKNLFDHIADKLVSEFSNS